MNVYLVRHGLARSNLEHPEQCPYDPIFEAVERHDHSLTPQGERQADKTGIRLANIEFDAALVSPFHRTMSTCAGILRHQKKHLKIECIPALVENFASHFRMMPMELANTIWPDIELIMENDLPDDNADTLWARANRVVDYVKGRFGEDDNVLIVSHGGFLSQYLIAAFMGLPKELAMGYVLGAENCGITKVSLHSGHRTRVMALDETGHLGEDISREPFDF